MRRAWRWLATRVHYRLHGTRYGHTALTDPDNVQFVIVDEDEQ